MLSMCFFNQNFKLSLWAPERETIDADFLVQSGHTECKKSGTGLDTRTKIHWFINSSYSVINNKILWKII